MGKWQKLNKRKGTKLLRTVVAEREQRVPPRNLPADHICSAFSAAIQLQIYTSAVQKAISEGLIDGGVYTIPGKTHAIWWVNYRDLIEVLPDNGGGWRGAELRRRREFLKLHGKENAPWLQT